MKSLMLLSEESGILLFSDSYEKKSDLDNQYASLETIQLSSSLFALYKLSLSLSNGALQWLQKGDSLLLFRSSPKGKQTSSDCYNGEGLLLIVDIDIAFERKIAEDITDKMFNVFLRHNLSPAQSPRLSMQKVLRAAIADQFCEIICDFLRHLIAVESSSNIFSNINKSTHILLCRPSDVTESIIGSRIPDGPSPDILPDKDHGCLHLPSPAIPIPPSSVQSDESLLTSTTGQFHLFWCCAFILRYCMCFGAPNIIAVPLPPPSSVAHLTDPIIVNTNNAVHPKRSVLLLSNPLGEKSHGNTYCSFQKSQADAAYDHDQKIDDDRGLNANMCKHFIEASNRSVLLNDDGSYVTRPDERKGNHGYKGSHCIPLSEQEFHITERSTILTRNSDMYTERKLNDNVRNSCYEVKTTECYGIRILICTSTNTERSIAETEKKALEVDKEKGEICDSLSAWKHLCIFGAIGFNQGFIPTINQG